MTEQKKSKLDAWLESLSDRQLENLMRRGGFSEAEIEAVRSQPDTEHGERAATHGRQS